MINQNSMGYASSSRSSSFYWQEETYLTYINDFGKHRVNAMAGASWQGYKYNSLSANQQNFTDDFYGIYNLGNGTDRPSVGTGYDKWTMNSYFLRVAYNYDSRYLATVTGRYDGSSRFGQNNKYAFFPSVGLGWVASNEKFWNSTTVNHLKLHSSFGVTGNSEIGTFRSLATVSQGNIIIGGVQNIISYLDNLENSKLKWEKTSQFDIGYEVGFFNSRLTLDMSYYYKYTNDLLLDRPVPETTGYSSIMDNVGAVSNQGIDVLITGHPIQTADFNWTSTLNFGWNKNRVEKLDESSSVDPVIGQTPDYYRRLRRL